MAHLRHRRQPLHRTARVHRVATPAEATGHLPLRQTLPPQLYARVEALKARYDPNDDKLETMRPMLAARQLTTRVFDAAGLALHNEVQETVLQLARAQDVRVRQDKLHDRRSGRRAQGRQRDPARQRGRLPRVGGDAARDRHRADAGARAAPGRWATSIRCASSRTPTTAPPASPPSPPPSGYARSSPGPQDDWLIAGRGQPASTTAARSRCSRWIGCSASTARSRRCAPRAYSVEGP